MLRLVAALRVAAPADLRAQRRRDVAAARHAGGHRNARARRQRRRRGAGNGDHAHRRRAVQQRHRLRPVRHPLGRQATRRPERVGPRARGVVAIAVPRSHRHARARLGHGDDPRLQSPGGARCRSATASCRSPTCSSPPSATRATACRVARRSRRSGRNAVSLMPQDLGVAEHFLPRGRAPQPGELFSSPRSGRARSKASRARAAMRSIAASLRRRWWSTRRRTAARTRVEDFAAHTIDWVTPLALDYRGVTVHEIPPNGQGIAALIALGILEHFDLASLPPDSVASQHLQIEAMKLAFADANRYVSDRAHDGAAARGAARPGVPRIARTPHRSAARAGLRPGRAAARRHGLSVRGRRAAA